MLGAEAVLALCWSKYSDWRHFKESLFLDELKLGAKPKLLVLKTLALLESSEARHCLGFWLGFCAATAGEDSECSLSILNTPFSLSLSVSVTLALPGSYALIDGGPDMDRQLTFFVFKFWPKPINSWAHRVPRGPRE